MRVRATHPGAAKHPGMSTPGIPSSGTPEQMRSWLFERLVDEMFTSYVEWREEANAVADAYRRWCDAPAPDRSKRHAAYLGALDREQAAAMSYSTAVTDVELAVADDQDSGGE